MKILIVFKNEKDVYYIPFSVASLGSVMRFFVLILYYVKNLGFFREIGLKITALK